MNATTAPPLLSPQRRDPAWSGRVFWMIAALVLLWPMLQLTEFTPWVIFEPSSLKYTARFLSEIGRAHV